MIRQHRTLAELTPDAAYMLGWQDHADSLVHEAEAAADLRVERDAARLDAMLDRIVAVAPWPEVRTLRELGLVGPAVFDWDLEEVA